MSQDPVCARRLQKLGGDIDPAAAAARSVGASFALDATSGPFVSSSVAAWRSARAAGSSLTGLRALLRDCPRWTEVYADGTRAQVRLTKLAMPRLGADRVGVRLGVTVRQGAISVTAHAEMAVVRVKNAATSVMVTRFGPAAAVDVVALSRVATLRLAVIF